MSTTTSPTTGAEQAAMRKVLYQLAELDGRDTDGMSIVEAANATLENVTDLQQRVESLEATIEELEERTPAPEKKAYEQMDRADKATVVRSKLKRTAEATNGRAAMKYKDIVSCFDGKPSAGHAFDIMDTAAERDNVSLGTCPKGEKRITIKTDS